MKRKFTALVAVLALCSLIFPVFASTAPEYVSRDSFWNWIAGNGGIVQKIVSYAGGTGVCALSEDTYHHASSYVRDKSYGYYKCVCDYCGKSFTAYESDLQQSYQQKVESLPAPGIGLDGSIYVLPRDFSFKHSDASSIVVRLKNGEIYASESGYRRGLVNLPLIEYELLQSSYHPNDFCSYELEISWDIPYLCSAELSFSSATYISNKDSGQLFASKSSGYVENCSAGSAFSCAFRASAIPMVKNGSYLLPGNFVRFYVSVFDKGIITRHLKNRANLHETATIGETQSGGFFCDMAGVHWGPPCFGYQGGPQQTPAIPPAKSNYRHSNFETKCPKATVVPAHFCIGALVVYPPSPPTIEHRRELAVKGA